jgi:hypothetical protein
MKPYWNNHPSVLVNGISIRVILVAEVSMASPLKSVYGHCINYFVTGNSNQVNLGHLVGRELAADYLSSTASNPAAQVSTNRENAAPTAHQYPNPPSPATTPYEQDLSTAGTADHFSTSLEARDIPSARDTLDETFTVENTGLNDIRDSSTRVPPTTTGHHEVPAAPCKLSHRQDECN